MSLILMFVSDVNAKTMIVVFCRYLTSAFWIWGVLTELVGNE